MDLKPLTINPTQMSEQEKKILNRFISKSKEDQKFLFEDSVYELKETNPQSPNEQTSTSFTLTHDLLQYPCKKHPDNYHYEVFSFKQQLSSGGFGMIFLDTATLDKDLNSKQVKNCIIKLQRCDGPDHSTKNNESNLFYTLKPDQQFKQKLHSVLNHLEKEQEFNKKKWMSFDKYMREIELTKLSGLRMKQPFIIKVDEEMAYTFTIMEYCKGQELFEVIRNDLENKSFLSTNLRIQLTLELLQSLKNLHDKGIVHRDIKPENIIVDLDLTTEKINSLHIIDFNLSKYANQKTDDSVGTLEYIPPEGFSGKNVDHRFDIFSLGKVIGLIWRSELTLASDLKSAYRHALNPTFNYLFQGIHDITANEKNIIEYLLINMTSLEVANRISLSTAIELIELLQKQRQMRMHLETSPKTASPSSPIRTSKDQAYFEHDTSASQAGFFSVSKPHMSDKTRVSSELSAKSLIYR